MKQIDKIILISFIKIFLLILFVVIFILLIQIFYTQMNVIIGKNLGFGVYVKLFMYMGIVSLPLAAPIATLVSCIICFTSMSETLELTALKSLGVSFQRIFKPLLCFIMMFLGCVFTCNNYLIPISYRNMRDLLFNLEQVNPLNAIKDGMFYTDFPDYSIYIEKKLNNNFLKNIIIYSNNNGNEILTIGDTASLQTVNNGQAIILQVNNGYNYVESNNSSCKSDNDLQIRDFLRMKFNKQQIIVDTSSFKLSNSKRTDSRYYSAMTTWKMIMEIQNLKKTYSKVQNEICDIIMKYYCISNNKDKNETSNLGNDDVSKPKLMELSDKYWEADISKILDKNHDMLQDDLSYEFEQLDNIKFQIRMFRLYYWKRISETFACLIMLILGVSMGILLEKGKLRVILLLSTFFVILYNVTVITTEKLAKAGVCNLFIGTWGAILVMIPFALFFYYCAKKDKKIFGRG